MNTLHILNSPLSGTELAAQFALFGANDSVIFIQDGCYTLANSSAIADKVNLYALEDDLKARNITCPDSVKVLDYPGFVDLTLAHHKTISW